MHRRFGANDPLSWYANALTVAPMIKSRIPRLGRSTVKSISAWLSDMHSNSLLFCLDNDPAELVRIADGATMFSAVEVSQLRKILVLIRRCVGEDMHALSFEVVSMTFHTADERYSFGDDGGRHR